ncbi:MAG: amino acid permease [Oligoflexia bacterium]|nr:amino acid permease [Oligoflexia bacterium]
MKTKKVDLRFGIAIIIANMIGVGVYTSIGFQVADIKSASAVLLLWLVGGIMAFCGALVYAELAMVCPGSGGECNYLGKIFGPSLGFLAGWVSFIAGFSAPIAAGAIAFSKYMSVFFTGVNPAYIAVGLVVLICVINLQGLGFMGNFQKGFMYLNLFLVLSLIVSGLIFADSSHFQISFNMIDLKNVVRPEYAISLVYVAYAYTGWNAVTYVAGEVDKPQKNIPLALMFATIIVTVLYILLNFVFLYAVPMDVLAGKVEVAQIAAGSFWGIFGVKLVGILIGLGLLACINSMMLSGSYVLKVMLQDFKSLKYNNYLNDKGAPVFSVLMQTFVALTLILTSTFQEVMIYMGFILTLLNSLAVAGVFIIRRRNITCDCEAVYRTPFYPYVPLLFLLLSFWMMLYVFIQNPIQSIAGIFTLILGLLVFYFLNFREKKNEILTISESEG